MLNNNTVRKKCAMDIPQKGTLVILVRCPLIPPNMEMACIVAKMHVMYRKESSGEFSTGVPVVKCSRKPYPLSHWDHHVNTTSWLSLIKFTNNLKLCFLKTGPWVALHSNVNPMEVFALWLNYYPILVLSILNTSLFIAFKYIEANIMSQNSVTHEWIDHTSDYSLMVHWVLIPNLCMFMLQCKFMLQCFKAHGHDCKTIDVASTQPCR